MRRESEGAVPIDRSSAPEPRSRNLELGVGVHGGIEGGVAPKPLFALPAFVHLRVAPSVGATGLHLAPIFALRLGFVTASARTVLSRDTSVDMRFTSGRLDVCPFEARAGGTSLAPCPGLELGVLEGRDVAVARSEQRFWAAASLPVRLRYDAGSSFFFEVEGGARLPFVRDRFVIQAETEVFRAPPVGWMASLGAGFGFR